MKGSSWIRGYIRRAIKQIGFKAHNNSIVEPGAVSMQVVKGALKNKDLPFLVSFPRTGSHWLRMILEAYADRPLLTRTFYAHRNTNYLLYHTHDVELTVEAKRVIYLYRNPVDVVYSQLQYYNQLEQSYNVLRWSYIYGCHLYKWMFLENFTDEKVIVRYERMKESPFEELYDVLNFLNLSYDEDKVREALDDSTKMKISSKTRHDNRVIRLSATYEERREEFQRKFGEMVLESFGDVERHLGDDNNHLENLF